MTIRITLAGATGWVGRALVAAVAAAPDNDGLQRIELAIEWNEPGRRGHPLRLAGWLPSASGEQTP